MAQRRAGRPGRSGGPPRRSRGASPGLRRLLDPVRGFVSRTPALGRPLAALAAVEKLLPHVDADGPHIRLGLVWGTLTFAAVLAGPGWLAVVMAAVALAAAGQAAATWRRRRRRPYRPVAVAGAALIPLAALVSPLAVGLVVLVVAGGAAAAPRIAGRDAALTAAVAVLVGTAAAAPVAVRDAVGPLPAVALFLFAHAHDAGAFLVGSESSKRWHAPLAGAATAAAMTVFVAAVLVPPFRGASPWVVGLIAVALTPLGPALGSLVVGERARPVPALRRLDVLVGFGPVFGAAAAAAV